MNRTRSTRPGLTWVGLGAAAAAALVALFAAPALVAQGTALPRATADRPDDRQGAQVHVVYAVPSDGADRALDTDGTVAASVANWQRWLRGQTGGRGLNLDTAGGEVDVTFARLPQTDAAYAARGLYIRDAIEADLRAGGLALPGSKITLVYYDGSSTAACGGGAYPPSLPGTVGAVYMRATYGAGLLCYTPSQSLGGLQIMDLAILHEALHVLGMVPGCAPHHTRFGHTSDSPTDLMYAGDEPWRPTTLDVGRDDYFDAPVAGCPDLAESPFFGSTSEAAPPSGGGTSGGTSGGSTGGGAASGTVSLRVAVAGPGRVTSAPAGIVCPGRCTARFTPGATVTLRAVPRPGARLRGWSGSCTGGSRTCRVSLAKAQAARATFVR